MKNSPRPKQSVGALFLGGHFHTLGAARALAAQGVPVIVSDQVHCVSQFSRAVRRFLQAPPYHPRQAYVRWLCKVAEQYGLEGWVVYPSDDESVCILSQHHPELARFYRLATPPWEISSWFMDKRRTWALAQQVRVPMPQTVCGADPDRVERMLRFPVVVKPAMGSRFMSVTRKKAFRADTPALLKAILRRVTAIIPPDQILIQELIPGRAENLYSFFGLFDKGNLLTGHGARRPRQHPMDFGRASTLVELVGIQALRELACTLMSQSQYSGLAEIEFMYDPLDERYELLEVNPRIWGWHTLAWGAGVNLVYQSFRLALGEQVSGGDSYDPEVRWVRLLTDLPVAFSELVRGRLSVGAYIRTLKGRKVYAVLSRSDPWPFFAELLLMPIYARTRGF